MGTRKETPDILGALLGGSKPFQSEPTVDPVPPAKQEDREPESGLIDSQTTPGAEGTGVDIEYGEGLLTSAAHKLKAASKVLDRQRLIDWLDQMQLSFGGGEVRSDRQHAETALKHRAAEWAERHLKAKTTTIGYMANGLTAKRPYEIDIWAHLKGERFRPDLDLWIDCREENEPVTRKDISEFVEKATDVFRAAHTDKQEFWFDRLMFVSLNPFDQGVLELADEYGVICVLYDRTSFLIQTDPYWKLKPRWLKDAEDSQD